MRQDEPRHAPAPPTDSRRDRRDRRDNRPLVRVLAAAAGFYAVFILRTSWVVDGQRRFTLFDDAMISMSYAQTFAAGHGLVWHPGAPRVEGFTNPLWVLMMAGLHAVGLSGTAVVVVVMLVGAALCLTAAVLAVAIARRLTDTTPGIDAAIGGLVAFSYPLVYWSLRGMEVGLVTVLALAAVWLALRIDDPAEPGPPPPTRMAALLAVTLVAGVTTRLDFTVIALTVIGWLAWRVPRDRRAPAIVAPAAAVAIAVAAQELLRHWYYGVWVPNTYTLKTTGVPLLDRLTRGGWVTVAATVGGFAATLLLVALAARRRRLGRPSATALLVAVGAALVAYSTYVGGDAWEWMAHPNRYLVPATILFAVAAAGAATDLLRAAPERDPVLVVGVAGAGVLAVLGPWLGFGILRASGVGAETRIGLDGDAVALVLVAVAAGAALAGRRLAEMARRGSMATAAVATIVVLAIGANLLPLLQWVGDGGAYQENDRVLTELGLALEEVTLPGASIAVTGAGAPIYWSDRAGVDLLGKNDRHLAALPSRRPFLPGHTKWDYGYSIAGLRPDVIAEVFRPTPEDRQLIADAGYRLMTVRPEVGAAYPLRLLVRRDSTLVDRTLLDPA